MEDDRPIGGGGNSATAFNFDQNPDAFQSSTKVPQPGSDGPLQDRLKNKNWKIRSDAFDQLIKTFKTITDKRDPTFRQHSSFFQKYLQDSHPTALQKAITALQIMAKYSDQSKSFISQWIKPLVQKGLSHTKPVIKEKANSAILTIAEESQKFRDIIQCLEQLLSNKVPKTQIAAITAVNQLLHNFGTTVIQIKPFIPKMQVLSGHSNMLIRTGSIAFYAECQRWLGSAVVEPLVDHLKAAQKSELQKKVQQITTNDSKIVRPKRFPASKRVQEQIKMNQQEKKQEDDNFIEEDAAPSAYDFAQEVNPWGEFNQEWIQKVNSQQKWNQKTAMLDILTEKCNVTKLSPDKMGGVIPGLIKFASSTNVNISGAGIKAILNISKGTRVYFKPHAKSMLNILFQKYKQRKPALINAVRDTLESFYDCFDFGLQDVIDQVTALFKDKNPTIKVNVLKWVSQITLKTYIDDLKPLAQSFIPQLSSLVNESNSQVRDACLSYLGILKARLGQQALANILSNLIASKASKVDQSASEVKKTKYDIPKKVVAPPKRAQKKIGNTRPKSKPKIQSSQVAQPPIDQNSNEVLTFSMGGGSQQEDQGFKPPPLKRKKKPEQNKQQSKGPPQLSSSTAPKKPAASAPSGPPKKPIINIEDQVKGNNGPQPSKEQAEELATQLFDQEIMTNINQTKWKEKSLALQAILQWITQNTQVAQQNTEAVIIFIKSRLKDFKESNINLVKCWIAIVSKYAEITTSVNKRTANMVMSHLIDKIGDAKFKALVEECLFNLASILGQGFIAKLIVKYGSDAKNPNVLKQVCNFLAKLPEEFATANGLPLKEIIDFGKIVIANSNPGARTSATSLLVAYYQWCGQAARGLILKDIKESTQKVVEAELGKVQPHPPGAFQAKRQFRGQAAQALLQQSKEGGKKKGGNNASAAAALLDDALPRQDISSQLSKKLLKQFSQSNWKPKKDACQKVEAIIQSSGNRILPSGIGQLVGILKNMISVQSNKAVQKALFKLIGKLGFALGSASSKITGKFFPKLIDFLSNKNADVRSQILKCMDSWGDAIGPQNLFAFFPQRLKNESPQLRCDLIAWILGVIGKQEQILSSSKIQLKPFIAPLLNCLGAKEGSVRGVAQKFISHIAAKTGTSAFYLVMKDLKQGVAKQIKPIIDRYHGLCPDPQGGMNKTMNKVKSVASFEEPSSASSNTPKINKFQQQTQNKFQKRGAQNQGFSKTSSNFNTSPAPAQQGKIGSNRGPSSGAVQRTPAANQSSNHMQQQKEQSNEEFQINIGQRQKRLALLRKCQFSMEQVRSDQISKLKTLALQTFGPQMEGLLFHKDFKKHIQAATTLSEWCQTQPNDMREVIDVVIRWIYVRLIDHQSNTALVKSVIQLIKAIIAMHQNYDIRLHDTQGKLLLASMIQKTGVNNTTFRKELKDLIFNCSSSIYSHTRVMAHLMGGLRSKNLKSTAECLDLISQMIQTFGIQIIGSGGSNNSSTSSFDKDLKEICKFLDSSDANVRNNALSVLADVYKHMREDIWQCVQPLSAKRKDLMDARFKKLNLMAHSTSTHSLSGFGFSTGGGAGARSKSPINSQSGIGMGNKANKSIGMMNKTSFTPRIEKKQQLVNSLGMNARQNIHQLPQQQNLFQSAIQRPTTSIGSSYNSVRGAQEVEQPIMNQQPQQQQFKSSLNANRNFSANQTPQQLSQQYSSQNNYQQYSHQSQFKTYDQGLGLNNEPSYLEQRPATSAGFYPQVGGGDRQQIDANAYMSQQQESSINSQANSTMQSLQICVNFLKFGETPEKQKALQSLNQIITQHDNKLYLQTNINQIIEAFCAGMVHTFDRPLQHIPISFAKRFLHVVGKVASMRSVINELDQDQLMNFQEQLLRKLLIEGLNQTSQPPPSSGQASDGEKIVKSLNTTMLRLLENCSQTRVFSSLLRLMKKYCADPDHPKMAGLIIKCLLKLTKVLDKLIKELNIDKILLVIHQYLLAHPSSHKSQRNPQTNSNQELGTRIVKTIINELVKLKGKNIWNHFSVVRQHPTPDSHIERWIKIIIAQQKTNSQAGSINNRQSIQSRTSQNSNLHQQSQFQQSLQSYASPSSQLDKLIKSLKLQESPSQEQKNYALSHNLDLQSHLQKQGDQVSAFVNDILQESIDQQKEGKIKIDLQNEIMSDRNTQMMKPRQVLGMKKDEKSHQSTSQLPTYSNSKNISTGYTIPNPVYKGGSATPSSFSGFKQISELKAKWNKQNQIAAASASTSRQQQSLMQQQKLQQQQPKAQQSLHNMRSMLSTTIGATDLGNKTPKKFSQQEKLNSSFSNASINQTAKKWLDRKEQRQKSQDAQLVRPNKSSLLNSPGAVGVEQDVVESQNLDDFTQVSEKAVPTTSSYNQKMLSNHNFYNPHHQAPDHKHHLSMTGYTGSSKMTLRMSQNDHNDESSGSSSRNQHKSLNEIRSKLDKMKQQICANKENSKRMMMYKKANEE